MTLSRFDISRASNGLWCVVDTAIGGTAHYDGIRLEHLSLPDADDLARLLSRMAARAAHLERCGRQPIERRAFGGGLDGEAGLG